jgi:thiamine transporter
LASALRLACHVFAGYVFWSEGMTGWTAFWSSLAYNAPYVLGSWLISAVLLTVLYKRYAVIFKI